LSNAAITLSVDMAQCQAFVLMRCLQLRFDFDSAGVRREFDCLSKIRLEWRNTGRWPASHSNSFCLFRPQLHSGSHQL